MNEISPVLRKTINSSPFVLHPQRYTVLQVQECSNPQPHFLVTHEAEEVTVITTEKQRSLLQSDILQEQAWFQLIEFKMSTPFETPGFPSCDCLPIGFTSSQYFAGFNFF